MENQTYFTDIHTFTICPSHTWGYLVSFIMHCETYLDAISVQGTISLKFLRALKNMILQFKNKFDP